MAHMTTIEIPDLLEYPEILPLKDVPSLKNVLCYVIKRYPIEGIGVVITRKEGWFCSRISDFSGNLLEPDNKKYSKIIEKVMGDIVPHLMTLMSYAHMDKLLFYFADVDNPKLVDVRVSINKFCSPGFVKDIFGRRIVPIQEEIGKPIILNDENLEKLYSGKGDYKEKDFILKPSVFKTIIRDDKLFPLYGAITNEIIDDS